MAHFRSQHGIPWTDTGLVIQESVHTLRAYTWGGCMLLIRSVGKSGSTKANKYLAPDGYCCDSEEKLLAHMSIKVGDNVNADEVRRAKQQALADFVSDVKH